jgi:hypothetical protein
MSLRTFACGTLLLLSVSLCGCEGGAVGVGWNPQGPSMAAPVSVSLAFSNVGVAPFVGRASSIPFFDVAITASSAVDVDEAMFTLIDGTTLGGPMITIPHASLVDQFGSTRIAAGASRVFRMRPFSTFPQVPLAVGVDVTVVDGRNVRHHATDQRPWQ